MLSGHKEKAIENYRRATRDRSNDGKREASVEEVKGAVRGYQQIATHSRAATKATRPLTHTKKHQSSDNLSQLQTRLFGQDHTRKLQRIRLLI